MHSVARWFFPWTVLAAISACGGSNTPTASSADGGIGGGQATGGNASHGGAGGGQAAGGQGALPACTLPTGSGEATYYDADGTGNCSFDASVGDLLVAAFNDADYDGSNACGSCVQVSGPAGSVTVRIVDRCPGCNAGDIDLSRQAFAQIAELSQGRIAVSWNTVPCDVTGPVRYRFKEGSSQWWTAVQVRNHRTPIASLSFRDGDGNLVNVPRKNYNYFVQEGGMGPGPYVFELKDALGEVLTDTNIGLVDAGEVEGAKQLAGCLP